MVEWKKYQTATLGWLELPFDSDRKSMTTIHKYGEKFIVIAKGAVESITSILKVPDLKQPDFTRSQ